MDQSDTDGQMPDDVASDDGPEPGATAAEPTVPDTRDSESGTDQSDPEGTETETVSPVHAIALPASRDSAAGLLAPTPAATTAGLEPARPSTPVPVWGPVVPPPIDPGAGGPAQHERPRRGPGWVWGAVVVAAALIGALIGGGIVALTNSGSTGATVKEISAGPALLNGVTNVETVIGKVLPAIVSIDAKGPAPASQSIFGDGSSSVEEDQGTGMIITPSGEVVTNNHVIAGATTITVTLYGSIKPLPATLVDTDATNDVALLQITGQSNLPTVTYGNSDNVQVGDAVVAIGNALGLSAGTPTVTQGIISAKGRSVQASDSWVAPARA